MSNSSYIFALLLTCGLVSPFLINAAHAETLEESLGAALYQNPTLDQAIQVQKMAHEDVKSARSAFFPTVSLSTAGGRVYGDNATSRGLVTTRGAAYSNLWEGSISINQMIFDSLKTPRILAAARQQEEQSKYALDDARETLSLQTALSYLNVLRIRESLQSLEAYKISLADYKSKIDKMVQEGASDEAEAQQAKSLDVEIMQLQSEFSRQGASASAEFLRLTGHSPEANMVRPANFEKILPPSLDEALQISLRDHPQVKMANCEIASTALNKEAKTSSLFPTVTGELSSYRKDVKDDIGGEVEDDRALVRLNWAMSTGGAELASVERAKADAARAKAARADLYRRLQATVQTAYSDMMALNEQKVIAQQKLSASESLLEAYKAQFEGGKVRILQLLQTENQVLNNKLDLLNLEYRFMASQVSLLGSMGQLTGRLGIAAPQHDQ